MIMTCVSHQPTDGFCLLVGTTTYVHAERDNHEAGIEANEWFILLQAMVPNQLRLNSAKKEVV
jgi:hypothetical protein